MGLTLGSTVLNTTDLPRGVRFWGEVLGAVPREGHGGVDDWVHEGWVTLELPQGGRLSLQTGTVDRVEQDQPIHLDLSADDRDAEVRRVAALGAEVVTDWPYPEDGDYTLLRDPDGHLFCIVDAD